MPVDGPRTQPQAQTNLDAIALPCWSGRCSSRTLEPGTVRCNPRGGRESFFQTRPTVMTRWPTSTRSAVTVKGDRGLRQCQAGHLHAGGAGPLRDRQVQRRTHQTALPVRFWAVPDFANGLAAPAQWSGLRSLIRARLPLRPARGCRGIAGDGPWPLAGSLWARERPAPHPGRTVPADDGRVRRGHAPGIPGQVALHRVRTVQQILDRMGPSACCGAGSDTTRESWPPPCPDCQGLLGFA